MNNWIIALWQEFIYGVLKRSPNFDFSKIPLDLHFTSHYDEANDVHWVEVADLPDFVVTGKTTQELARNFTDTLLVYFDVPTYFAKRFKPDDVQFKIVNQKTNQEEVIHLNYREELSKVLA